MTLRALRSAILITKRKGSLSDFRISRYENRLGTKASDSANWDRKLAWPVTVRGGGGPIATLTNARVFILNLPDSIQGRAHWLLATEFLLKAADSGSDAEIDQVTLQIERALIADGRLSLE